MRKTTLLLERVLQSIEKDIRGSLPAGKTGILATGGLDSSLLARMAGRLKPRLYFCAVVSRKARAYNRRSISQCRRLARHLGLSLTIIPLRKKDYLASYLNLQRFFAGPPDDYDLPAVCFFFKKISESGKTSAVLSAMGANEVFDLPSKDLKTFLTSKAPLQIEAHKKLAALWQLDFHAPFLDKRLFSYALKTPLSFRKGKAPLKEIAAHKTLLPRSFIFQRPRHTVIPEEFKAGLRLFERKSR